MGDDPRPQGADQTPPENAVETTDDTNTDDTPMKVDEPKPALADPRRPKPFNYDAVMPIDEWEKWANSFKSYLCVTKLSVLSDRVKISALLVELGTKGEELLESFKTNPPSSVSTAGAPQAQDGSQPDQPAETSNQNCVEAKPKTYDFTKYEDVISAFTAHFVSKSARNLVYERFKFNTFNWLFGKPLSDYIKGLRRAAVRCDFLEMDSMIRDRLLLQVRDITLLEGLLKIKDLTLEKAIEMCQEHEDKDYRHNPAAQRPPPESESAAKRRRKRKRKTAESAGVDVQSEGEARKDSGSEANYNKGPDTTKLKPSKKRRNRWAKARRHYKEASLTKAMQI